MADKSKVAEAYAEVRADLSKLPGDLGKVPGIVRSMLSTEGVRSVAMLLGGNVSGALVNLTTKRYEQQAQKLRDLADAANEARKATEMQAAAFEQKGADKTNPNAKRDAATGAALRIKAARQAATADGLKEQAAGMDKMGAAVGAKVAIAAKVGLMAVAAVTAAAAAYIGTMVLAAKRASENLKTTQLIRATGQAAGWTSEQLQHMGENLRKTTSFSDAAISGAQQALLKHPNIGGREFEKALKTAANLSAVMGTELPQAAAELGDLLADPIKAAEGGLEKYGVLLDGLEQGQIRNAVAARDYAKAQNLVLDKLSKFGGAAEEAANTGAGGFDRLKNSLLAAATRIGGLNGDIGTLAARVAKAVDAFMELQIVKDVLDLITAPWRLMKGLADAFFDSNGKDFETWGAQVSEVYHNLRDQVMGVWESIKSAAQEAGAWVLAQFGSSVDGIKAYITGLLDVWTLATADIKLTAQFLWTGIQLGAQQLWDALKNGLTYLRISFQATWDSVVAGAEAAWESIKNGFTGGDVLKIGDTMAQAFRKSFADGLKDSGISDSDEVRRLKGELEDVFGKMQAARDANRKRRAEEEAARLAKNAALEKPGPETKKNNKPFAFEFTGFEELAKKIQTSIYPTEAIQLQRAGVALAEKAAVNGEEANKKLADIVEAVKGGIGFAK